MLAGSIRRTLSTVAGVRRIPIFQVDAFASSQFSGNPAAVHPLEEWLPDATLLSLAAENNLAETAFTVPMKSESSRPLYHLRWFTPTLEVDMCGHATLATAAVILERLQPGKEVEFETRSGRLIVTKPSADASEYTLDFPLWPVGEAVTPPAALAAALSPVTPTEAFTIKPLHGAPYYLFLYDDEATVRSIEAQYGEMEANVVATSRATQLASEGVDFVSRWFGPLSGIPEDPVTGSAHSTLAPFWAARLGKSSMVARQVSKRGGELLLEMVTTPEGHQRVKISGPATFYMEGTAFLPA
jgi:predicted PhzF superfamily epimerase YddE/YHI9